MFHRDVGGIDRLVRLGLGTGVLGLGVYLLVARAAYAVTVTLLGSVLLITGMAGFCPPYVLFGNSTAEPKPGETDHFDGCCRPGPIRIQFWPFDRRRTRSNGETTGLGSHASSFRSSR
jgi:hypothetical protein